MNIIQEISEIVISKGMKDIEEVMLEGGNISELTTKIEKVVNGIGRELTRYILEETDREVRESRERKRKWNIQKRGVENTYQTIFGEVRYERTYYKRKQKKEFVYLSDLVFGIESNCKVEPMIKIRAIEKAIDMSYEKSGELAAKDIKLSKQSVMTEIRALGEVKKESKAEEKKEAVRKQKNYLIRNWDGIVNAKEPEYIGCSAEGHVSHILSARLSSRPMGWSKLGANLMANLRAYRANCGKIVNMFYARAKKQELQKKRILMDEEIVKKRLRKTTYETRGNITVLNMGKKTWLSGYLKSVRGL